MDGVQQRFGIPRGSNRRAACPDTQIFGCCSQPTSTRGLRRCPSTHATGVHYIRSWVSRVRCAPAACEAVRTYRVVGKPWPGPGPLQARGGSDGVLGDGLGDSGSRARCAAERVYRHGSRSTGRNETEAATRSVRNGTRGHDDNTSSSSLRPTEGVCMMCVLSPFVAEDGT